MTLAHIAPHCVFCGHDSINTGAIVFTKPYSAAKLTLFAFLDQYTIRLSSFFSRVATSIIQKIN